MKHHKNRNEVNLDDKSIEILQKLADKHRWKLKFYLEFVLTSHADRYRAKVPSNNQQLTEKNQEHI